MYKIFNYTDNIYATFEEFRTKKEAKNFISEFKNRFISQGHYRDSRGEKINISDIEIEVIPHDFNPLK